MAAVQQGTGLKKETAGALSYVLGPVTGVIFFILEKDSFVRFHAMQSIVFSVAAMFLNMVLGFTIILAIHLPLIWILEFILWLLLIYRASQGQEWEMPFLGKFARQLAQKA
jgi:uncharacterized membrane protein